MYKASFATVASLVIILSGCGLLSPNDSDDVVPATGEVLARIDFEDGSNVEFIQGETGISVWAEADASGGEALELDDDGEISDLVALYERLTGQIAPARLRKAGERLAALQLEGPPASPDPAQIAASISRDGLDEPIAAPFDGIASSSASEFEAKHCKYSYDFSICKPNLNKAQWERTKDCTYIRAVVESISGDLNLKAMEWSSSSSKWVLIKDKPVHSGKVTTVYSSSSWSNYHHIKIYNGSGDQYHASVYGNY